MDDYNDENILDRTQALVNDIDKFLEETEDKNINGAIDNNLSVIRGILVENPKNLAHIQIHLAINPERFMEFARNKIRNRWYIKAVNWLDIFRNVSILFPIILTWYALSKAINAYHEAIQQNSDLAYESFLLLWERGFNGNLGFWFGSPLTFSHVAIWDAGIVFFIMISTFLVHLATNWWLEKQEKTIQTYALMLNNITLQLDIETQSIRTAEFENVQIQSKTLLENINTFIKSYKSQGTELLSIIAAEQERLKKITESRKQEIKDLKTFAIEFNEASKKYHELTPSVVEATKSFKDAASFLTEETSQIRIIQSRMLDATQSLNGHIGGLESIINIVEKNLTRSTETISGSLNSYNDKLADLHKQSQKLDKTVEKVVDNQTLLTRSLNVETTITGELIKSINDSSVALSSTGNNLDVVTGQLTTTNEQLKGVNENNQLNNSIIKELSTGIEEFRKSLEESVAADKESKKMTQENNQRLSDLLVYIEKVNGNLDKFKDELISVSEISNQIRDIKGAFTDLSNRLILNANHNIEIGNQYKEMSAHVSEIKNDSKEIVTQLKTNNITTNGTILNLNNELAQLREVLVNGSNKDLEYHENG